MTALNYILSSEREIVMRYRQSASWHPLLDEAMSERALDAVQGIIAELPAPSTTEMPIASLAGGTAGLSVLATYLALAGLDDGENAMRFLEHAVQAVSSKWMEPSLYSGFTGVAWATAHLQKQLGETDDDDSYKALDEALRGHLSQSAWSDDFDLISGLVGFGVYALERLPHPSGTELLERVVELLDETAERNAPGITWPTPPELLPKWQRELCPNGYYNVGLAHGVPGVIALLGQACAANVARAKALTLLDGAIAWLLAQKLPAGRARSIFPSWIGSSSERDDCRLAWCYGDIGIAAALLAAARGAGEPAWEREAIEIARRAAERAPETAGVVDAGLCHGAAGLGHLFNRMYQATGEAQLKEAATFWFERTLDMRRPTGGIGGFLALDVVDGERRWVADPGLLMGAAGIALALLAAITPVEPAWDRILLVSIPENSYQRPARVAT